MKTTPLLIILLIFFASSCHKEDSIPPDGYQEVTWKNFTGLDGCGFLFVLKDGRKLEICNRNGFSIEFKEGKKYLLKYELASFCQSICMTGELIKIIDIKEPTK
jgi:hypothetical protein